MKQRKLFTLELLVPLLPSPYARRCDKSYECPLPLHILIHKKTVIEAKLCHRKFGSRLATTLVIAGCHNTATWPDLNLTFSSVSDYLAPGAIRTQIASMIPSSLTFTYQTGETDDDSVSLLQLLLPYPVSYYPYQLLLYQLLPSKQWTTSWLRPREIVLTQDDTYRSARTIYSRW